MGKNEWVKLADAYIKEAAYWHSLYHMKIKLAKEHGVGTDFVGNDYFDGPLTSTVEDLLGDDFCYWCFDCNQSFKKFNAGVTLKDGTHPHVESLGDLYDLSREER